jgi:hypothetical protein
MTDVLERRFDAVANEHDDSSWDEVRGRARRVPTRRVALLAAAAAVAVAVVTPAAGLHEPIVDFFSGERATDRVLANFTYLDQGAPPGMATGVVPGETRRVMTLSLSDGAHDLWVAPTRAGGFCTMWTKMGGGCDRLGTVPLSVSYGGEPFVASGHADADYVHAVEARYADGTAEPVDVTWVGAPIGAGFFAYEPERGRVPEVLVGLDRDGGVVTTHPIGRSGRQDLLSDAELDDRTELLSVDTPGGPARLWTAPTRYEGRCAWVEYAGRRYPAASCGPKGYSWKEGVGLGLVDLGGNYFLLGTAGPRFAPLELRVSDDRRVQVEPIDDIVFAKLPAYVKTGDTVTIVPADAGEDPRRHLVLPVQPMFD